MAPSNISAIVLLVLSVLSIIATGIIGLPSGWLAILSMKRNSTDPARAASTALTGWIAFVVNTVIGIPALIWLFWWAAHR